MKTLQLSPSTMVALEAAGGPLPPPKPPPTIQSPSSLPQHPHYAIPKTSTSRRRIVRTNASPGTRPHVAVHVQCPRDRRTPHHDASIMDPTSKRSTSSVIQADLLTNHGRVTKQQVQPKPNANSTNHTLTTTQMTVHNIKQKRGNIHSKPKNYTVLYKYIYKTANCSE